MAAPEALDTHHKALSINLDPSIFGSFAEIGAGQEVARWFLKVGAASGTVAKTVSAYDKEVSDDIYGAGSRYVSKQRLEAMLECEWSQLLVQLEKSRGASSRFFSFVNTIAARNFAGTNYCHGWIGLRFRAEPQAAPNDVILHVNLLDPTNLQQQNAVGILGVNLIFASFHERMDPSSFLKGLAQYVAPDRLEVDFIELRGPVFDADPQWDDKLVHARLVLEDLAEGVIFPVSHPLLAPTDVFHKKSVLLAPGKFLTVERHHAEMMSKGIEALSEEKDNSGNDVLGLFCVSSKTGDDTRLTVEDVMRTIDAMRGLGYGAVLIRDRELYTMSAFIKRFTQLPVRFVVGMSLLVRVFSDTYRTTVGSRLEGIARLFAQDIRVYAYPMPIEDLQNWVNTHGAKDWELKPVDGWVTLDSLVPPLPVRYLYDYVEACGVIVPLQNPRSATASSPATTRG
jgi:hypothetical protein